jgi:hypothetical protein
MKHAVLRAPHRLLERRLIRQLAEIGGQEHRRVTCGCIHLTGSEPMEIALQIAGPADRRAVVRVSLHRPTCESLRNLAAGIELGVGLDGRQHGRAQTQRFEQALRHHFIERHAEAVLQGKVDEHEAGMRVDHLLTRLVIPIGGPGIERGDEFRQRECLCWPRRMILRKHDARRVGRQLPQRDPANTLPCCSSTTCLATGSSRLNAPC